LHDTTYIPTPNGQFHVPVRIIGEIENAVVVADRVENPGMIWTKDGLYAGTLFDRRADDGLPATVYSWYLTEDNEDAITTTDNGSGGRLIQYPDGRVIWFTQGRNSVPVYEITGWEDWSRQTVSFDLAGESGAAAGEGTGLSADYYKGEFAGELLANRRETRIWHGLNYSALERDGVVDGPYGAVYDWTAGNELIGQFTGFSAGGRGEIEAPLTEDFVVSDVSVRAHWLWSDAWRVSAGASWAFTEERQRFLADLSLSFRW